MTLTIKSIIICLMILATAPDIHTREIRKSGDPEPLVTVSQDRLVSFGSGVEASQLPFAVYASDLNLLDVTVYIQLKKQCHFTFIPGEDGALTFVDAIEQLGGSRIILAWSAELSTKRLYKFSVLDMDYCKNKKDITYESEKTPTKGLFQIVPFVDSFDVVDSMSTIDSFDTNGMITDEVRNIPLNSDSFSISAVSGRTDTEGYFAVDYRNLALTLFKKDNTLFKKLQDLGDATVFSNNEQSLYSICKFNLDLSKDVHCYQYDQQGNEKWNNNVALEFDPNKLIMKNLPGGGLVLAVLNVQSTQLTIVEMGPNQLNNWTTATTETFEEMRLLNFNKQGRTFELVYENFHGTDVSVVLQKYSLG